MPFLDGRAATVAAAPIANVTNADVSNALSSTASNAVHPVAPAEPSSGNVAGHIKQQGNPISFRVIKC
jgi:hypothetical protein